MRQVGPWGWVCAPRGDLLHRIAAIGLSSGGTGSGKLCHYDRSMPPGGVRPCLIKVLGPVIWGTCQACWVREAGVEGSGQAELSATEEVGWVKTIFQFCIMINVYSVHVNLHFLNMKLFMKYLTFSGHFFE